jgi:hypothetical protein
LGVPDEGPSDDCLRDEAVVGTVPLSEVFKRRRFDASALLSRWDRAEGLLRCAWLRRAFWTFRGEDVRWFVACRRAIAALATLGAPPD